ncbi:MAG: TetR/AcrR family transcriptional regulator [Anaerolineae bacterium]|nr:TetR/AcrR family transcriptional regulator [Anaerolineae bacterium]
MVPKVDVSAERRDQIIQAALACFTRKGYNNTTMDDIVAESGLSKGTLYWYFKGKDDLFKSAILSFFERSFGQEAIADLEQCPTAAEKLRFLAQVIVGLGEWTKGIFNLFLEFWASSTHREEAAQWWTGLLVQYKNILVGIIEEGIRNGEFRPVDAEPLVWAMMSTYDGLAAYVMLMPDLELERISHVFIETLLRGLVVDEQEGD